MDYFSIGLNIFCLIAQGIMHVYFCASLTGKKQKAYHFAIYIFIFCILDWIASKFSFPWIIVIGIELLILYGVNRFILGNRPPRPGLRQSSPITSPSFPLGLSTRWRR